MILDRIFNRWTKWELHKEDQLYIRSSVNYMTGMRTDDGNVICDIMVKTNKYTGLRKYKNIVK